MVTYRLSEDHILISMDARYSGVILWAPSMACLGLCGFVSGPSLIQVAN